MYNINRRKFLGLFGCGCCSLILPSCTTVPITDRKQLMILGDDVIYPEHSKHIKTLKAKLN